MIDNTSLYRHFDVEIQLRDRLYGGVPLNSDLVRKWIEARTGKSDEITDKQVADVEVAIEDQVEQSRNGFEKDEHGLFIRTRNVKALMRECAVVLRITEQKRGSKQIIQHAFEVKGIAPSSNGKILLDDQKVHLGKAKEDGTEQRPIHVMTPQGPRTSIKVVDYVERPTLRFRLMVLDTSANEKRHITFEDLEKMLALAQEDGIGADRSQGAGKFNVTKFEQVKAK